MSFVRRVCHSRETPVKNTLLAMAKVLSLKKEAEAGEEGQREEMA